MPLSFEIGKCCESAWNNANNTDPVCVALAHEPSALLAEEASGKLVAIVDNIATCLRHILNPEQLKLTIQST